MNIVPLADRVVIIPEEAESKTKLGIIIPDTAKEKPQKGTVLAAGAGGNEKPLSVKEGDCVLYGKHSGTPITIEGKTYLIMRETDIYAILL